MNNPIAKQLQDVETLMQKGNINKAIDLITPLFEKESNNVQVAFLYGLLALRAKDYRSSIQILKHATNITTKEFKVNYHFALAYQLSREYDSAVVWYKKAIEIDADSVEARVNLAFNFVELGEFENAIKVYSEILCKQVNNLQIINLLAACYFKQKNYIKAIEAYQRTDKLTSNKLSNINIAHCYFYLNRDNEALEIYEKYTNGDTNYEPACRGIVNIYVKTKDYKSAEIHAENLLRLSSSHKNKYNLAMVLSHQTNVDKLNLARNLLTEVLKNTNLNGSVYDCLALINMKLGYLKEALDNSKRSVAINKRSIEFKYSLQSIYAAMGELEHAKLILIDILKLSPNHKHGLRQLGIVELRMKCPSEAIIHLLKAAELDDFDQRTISHQIIALQALGKFNESRMLQSFDRLVKIENLESIEYQTTKEFNLALESELKNHESLTWEPKGLATKGGYMTTALENETSGALKCLVKLIIGSIEQYRLSLDESDRHPFLIKRPKKFKLHLWGVILNQNGQVGPHIHEESWLSGAYYVKLPILGDDKNDFSGCLEFGTPHSEIPYRFSEENKLIEPEEGKLVLFPSYYFHQTIPYDDDNERISIAFDVEAIW